MNIIIYILVFLGIIYLLLKFLANASSKKISKQLNIPTIGIGSSAHCDGQILVIDDLIGLSENKFRFVKKYANLNQIINGTVKRYKSEVLKKQFPQKKHSFVN